MSYSWKSPLQIKLYLQYCPLQFNKGLPDRTQYQRWMYGRKLCLIRQYNIWQAVTEVYLIPLVITFICNTTAFIMYVKGDPCLNLSHLHVNVGIKGLTLLLYKDMIICDKQCIILLIEIIITIMHHMIIKNAGFPI